MPSKMDMSFLDNKDWEKESKEKLKERLAAQQAEEALKKVRVAAPKVDTPENNPVLDITEEVAAAEEPIEESPAEHMRQVLAIKFADIKPKEILTEEPKIIQVNPAELLVDERYQRKLSERSYALIKRIVTNWSWVKFKPPIVVRTDGKLVIIDGQHTSIAAVTRGIKSLPVVVHEELSQEKQAEAFVGHNKDRINVTPLQIYHANIASGNEDALTIDQVATNSGVNIRKFPPQLGKQYEPGDTLSISCISSLIKRRFPFRAKAVLQVCAQAKLAPISVTHIRAVEEIMFGKTGKDANITNEDLVELLSTRLFTIETRSKNKRAMDGGQLWQCMAKVIVQLKRELR